MMVGIHKRMTTHHISSTCGTWICDCDTLRQLSWTTAAQAQHSMLLQDKKERPT
jgi:hypothetical protein